MFATDAPVVMKSGPSRANASREAPPPDPFQYGPVTRRSRTSVSAAPRGTGAGGRGGWRAPPAAPGAPWRGGRRSLPQDGGARRERRDEGGRARRDQPRLTHHRRLLRNPTGTRTSRDVPAESASAA